jgi:alanine dehydrogenase
MLVGVPKEINDNEFRVALVPSTVRELTDRGHRVLVETHAGAGAGFADDDYRAAGAEIVPDSDAVFERAELIVKIKEPLAAERRKLCRGQVLFTYLHLAPDHAQTEDLMAAGVTAIAYETVTSQQGTLPLLTPMSEVAGRMAPHVGAHLLEKENGGRGVLLAGVPGVSTASVVILGGGVVGSNAAQIASGMGADVTVLDRNPEAPPERHLRLCCRVRSGVSLDAHACR